MRQSFLAVIIKAALLSILAVAPAYAALDAPHDSTNQIACGKCHWIFSYTTPPVWASSQMDIDDAAINRVCWTCHNDVVSRMKRTHSAATLGTKYGSTWTNDCKACHNNHTHNQKNVANSSLVSGNIASSDTYNVNRNTTKITLKTSANQSFQWGTDDWKSYICLVNDITIYDIVASDSTTITVEGNVALSSGTFKILRGMYVNNLVNSKDVKFFDKDGTKTNYSFVDNDGDTLHTGVCEVCHTQTLYFRGDGNACDDLQYKTQATCTAAGKTWGQWGCSNATYKTKATCESGGATWRAPHAYSVQPNENCTNCHKTLEGFKPSACFSCHGQSGHTGAPLVASDIVSDPVRGATGHTAAQIIGQHQLHAIDRGYSCNICHARNGMPAKDGKVTIGFSGIALPAGASPQYDGIDFSNPNYSYNATNGTIITTNDPTKQTCTNVYCHSSGQSVDGNSAVPYYTGSPNWTDPQSVGCGDCHPTLTPVCTKSQYKNQAACETAGGQWKPGIWSGSHNKHLWGVTIQIGCSNCHPGVVDSPLANNSTTHINGQINVIDEYDGGGRPGNGYGACNQAYCHSSGQGATPDDPNPYYYGRVSWGQANSVGCGICHPTAECSNATYTTRTDCLNNGATWAPVINTGSHANHITQGVICENCHQGAGDASDNTEYASANHRNHLIDVGNTSTGLTYSAGGAPGNGYGNCTNATCHTNVQNEGGFGSQLRPTPVWGSLGAGGNSCGICHLGDGKHGQATLIQSGSHQKHLSYNNGQLLVDTQNPNCSAYCHNTAGYQTAKHNNSNIDVIFSSSVGGAYSQVSNPPGNGYGTCQNVYCHNPGNVGNVNMTWGGALADSVECDSCHGGNKLSSSTAGYGPMSSGAHAAHINNSDANLGSFGCGKCHYNTVTDGNDRLITGAAHINFAKDVPVNCNLCHQNGNSVAVGPPAWTSGTTLDCKGCHGSGGTSRFGEPDTGSSGAAHAKHVLLAGDCGRCHNSTSTTGTTITGALHLNGVKNVTMSSLYGGSYTAGVGCSSVYCHDPSSQGNLSPVWGGSLPDSAECDSCHGGNASSTSTAGRGPMNSGSHAKHINLPGVYCGDCHANTVTIPNDRTITGSAHVNTVKDVAIVASRGGDGSDYSTVSGKCSTTNCHGTLSPAWGAAGSGACGTCHGMAANPADGRDTAGNTANTSLKVGAHVAHLAGSHGYGQAVSCNTCHNVPVSVMDAGHIDSALPAEVSITGSRATGFGALSATYNPTNEQCSNTWCHGAGLITGDHVPTWNVPVLTGVASNDCTQCHGYPPAGIPAHTGKLPTDCIKCHNYGINAAGTGFTDTTYHINGVVEGGGDACIDCHSAAGGLLGGSTPDATHAKHVGNYFVNNAVSQDGYGATNPEWFAVNINSGNGSYEFGCGNCHPADASNHMNGTVDISLNSSHGGTIKSRNGVANDTTGYTRTGDTGFNYVGNEHITCSAAYCHSDAQGGYQTSPDWYGGSFAASDYCANCHGNTPVGTSHNAHMNTVTIHYANIYNGSSGLLTPAQVHGLGESTTLNCNLCHVNTLSVSRNDKNAACNSCHTTGINAITSADLNKDYHVNGVADVQFASVNIMSKAQLRNSSKPAAWNRYDVDGDGVLSTGDYKTPGAHDISALPLSAGTFNRNGQTGTVTCAVVCHNNQQATWNDTGLKCGNCHVDLQ